MTDDIPARMDKQAEKLLEEFRAHLAEFHELTKRESPERLEPDGSVNARKVFEGWAIQKFANYEVLIQHLENRIDTLYALLGR